MLTGLRLDLGSLSTVQRVLLVTDGTLTHILEAYADERMELRKLSHSYVTDPSQRASLSLQSDERALHRVILLCGSRSRATYIYAESIVMLDRLPMSVTDGLLNTEMPIGKLLWKARAETRREITGLWQEPAGEVAWHFGIDPSGPVLCRSYQIVAGHRPIVMITEKFPRAAFLDSTAERLHPGSPSGACASPPSSANSPAASSSPPCPTWPGPDRQPAIRSPQPGAPTSAH